MFRFGLLTLVVGALTALALPFSAVAGGSQTSASESQVDFGDCKELATGTVVPLSELQDRVPSGVRVLSLTDQGFVFPGSDNLGILITRTLQCDSITVTRNGRSRTQYNRHIAQVGTPVDTSDFPDSPLSTDGGNGADFNNYIFAYYSDSSIYRQAMIRAGVRGVAPAWIRMVDDPADDGLVDRSVTVWPFSLRSNYGYRAHGVVPDATVETPSVSFVGNWWSARSNSVSVLSNNIPAQVALFIDPAATTVTLRPTWRSQLAEVFGAESATADAFGVLGFIPESDGTDMIIVRLPRD